MVATPKWSISKYGIGVVRVDGVDSGAAARGERQGQRASAEQIFAFHGSLLLVESILARSQISPRRPRRAAAGQRIERRDDRLRPHRPARRQRQACRERHRGEDRELESSRRLASISAPAATSAPCTPAARQKTRPASMRRPNEHLHQQEPARGRAERHAELAERGGGRHHRGEARAKAERRGRRRRRAPSRRAARR